MVYKERKRLREPGNAEILSQELLPKKESIMVAPFITGDLSN